MLLFIILTHYIKFNIIILGDIMFNSKESIKFMMAKIYFTLANFSYKTIDEVLPSTYHGMKTLEINYIRKGSGVAVINNKEYKIKEGTYIVIPEFVSYSIIPSTNINIFSIYLLIDDKTGFKEYTPLLDKYFIGNDYGRLINDFDELHYELKNLNFGYNEIVVSIFKKIIVKILRNEKISGKRISHWDTESLQYEIESIITKEFSKITIHDLANRLHLSIRELQRYLLKNYNKSFNELKTEAKMNYASNKLIYSDIKISKLYEELGYSTPEHFSYAFKKYFNKSPLQYRLENKKS